MARTKDNYHLWKYRNQHAVFGKINFLHYVEHYKIIPLHAEIHCTDTKLHKSQEELEEAG